MSGRVLARTLVERDTAGNSQPGKAPFVEIDLGLAAFHPVEIAVR